MGTNTIKTTIYQRSQEGQYNQDNNQLRQRSQEDQYNQDNNQIYQRSQEGQYNQDNNQLRQRSQEDQYNQGNNQLYQRSQEDQYNQDNNQLYQRSQEGQYNQDNNQIYQRSQGDQYNQDNNQIYQRSQGDQYNQYNNQIYGNWRINQWKTTATTFSKYWWCSGASFAVFVPYPSHIPFTSGSLHSLNLCNVYNTLQFIYDFFQHILLETCFLLAPLYCIVCMNTSWNLPLVFFFPSLNLTLCRCGVLDLPLFGVLDLPRFGVLDLLLVGVIDLRPLGVLDLDFLDLLGVIDLLLVGVLDLLLFGVLDLDFLDLPLCAVFDLWRSGVRDFDLFFLCFLWGVSERRCATALPKSHFFILLVILLTDNLNVKSLIIFIVK